MLDARHHRRFVAAAVLVGLAVRLAFALGYWRDKPLTHDEREYLTLSANLAAGRGLTLDLPGTVPSPGIDRFGRPPVYPAFLSVLVSGNQRMVAGQLPASVPTNVKIAQSLIGAATIALIALIASRAAGPRAGSVAAWLASLHPPLSWVSAYALTESLFAFLALGCVAVLSPLVDRRAGPARGSNEAWVALRAGALSGIGCLTRGLMLFFVPLAAFAMVRSRRASAVCAFLVGAALVLAPWAARNAAVHGRFIFVSSEGGVNFWIGNHPQAVGEGDMAANPQIKRANEDFRARHPGLTAEQLEPYYYQEAFAWIKNEPVAWLALLARKAFYSVVPLGPSYRARSGLYRAGTLIPYLALLPFGLAGTKQLLSGPSPPRALGVLVLAWALAGLAFFPQERFRIPIVDPALIVGAAAWITHRLPGSGGDRRRPAAEAQA